MSDLTREIELAEKDPANAARIILKQKATITNLLKENARLKVEIADLEQDAEEKDDE